ncbi:MULTISPECIES: lysophospholipid acyltransferase family protein [Myxococcus]|uniref:lysophospholipid acyltransferase family protein n=1 Tax=Myxococcus TaxID=32 RepID=UPI001144F5C0|nr:MULTISPECIES: lysophospholipid acyltransferase family protein [Myxococcus]NOK04793.1 acyltransferase family protein [Myxococcus xanthus]
MAKGVLGNDPFKRGAASRPTEASTPGGEEKAAAAESVTKKKPGPGGTASAKAGGKAAAAKSRKHEGKKTSGKAKGGKAVEGKKGAAAAARPPAQASGTRPPAPQADRTEAADAALSPREPTPSQQARAPLVPQTSAHDADDAVLPLREPAASTPLTLDSQAPGPVNDAGAPTSKQRDVDLALAEALAADVAEATATAVVDAALGAEAGPDAEVERLMATEFATELAEAAVEEALERGAHAQSLEQEQELAAAVAAQVADSAARAAIDKVRARHATPDAPAVTRWERETSVRVVLTEEADTSAVEPEVELPDATRDEFPPGRRGPLSLVPPPATNAGESSYRESFPPESGRGEPEGIRPLAERAVAALSLARDIAGQALASESLARAMLAMGGLKDMLRAGLGTGGGANLDEYGKDPSLVERLEPVLEFLYSQYWRVSVQGVDHVPPGAAILVANHSGALPYDGLVMSMALTRERPDLREPRWLVEDQVFHAPMVGTLFNRLGAVRACPENALRLLDEHRPLVVFPEGYQALSKPFGERYRLKRFGRGGFVKLALRTGAPIVPVAIVGAEETSPLLGRIPASFLGLPYVPLTPLGPLPLPAKWSIRFGEPIGVEDLAPEAADDLGEVQRLTERTREAIQSMLQSLLRERRSVFAG